MTTTNEKIEFRWRGEVYRVPADHLVLQGAGPTGSGVCLWEPRIDEITNREQWIADVYLGGRLFVEAHGASPQEALDALSAELPPGPMVRGGSC